MTGLTQEQVRQQIEAGNVNINENPNTRTYKQIFLENTLTFFNFINAVLLVLVLVVGSFKNAAFVAIIVINTVIGIIQEIRAKKTLDKLAILTASMSTVARDGQELEIPTDELVLGDVVLLRAGDQIPADAAVLEGSLEVNESLLTGETDTLSKSPGDDLFSGSFVTSGRAYCRVVHVGVDNYAAKITGEAKEFKKHHSELRDSLNKILKVVGIIILPLGLALFYKQFYWVGNSFRDSIVSTVAAVLGMIPEGLVLLTSVALTLGTMRLAREKTLVQELFCIETLARVDTLCLDKTGTITEGAMCVEQVLPLKPEENIPNIMANLMGVLEDNNATFQALRHSFPGRREFALDHVIPFSSDRKYSGACYQQEGTCLMGAVQFLFPQPDAQPELKSQCAGYASQGYRVLVLAHSPEKNEGSQLPPGLRPIALLLLTDVIRKEAPDTFRFFRDQGVDLKVISGDDPATVAAIAKKAGLDAADRYIDATAIQDAAAMKRAVAEYSVFGRVTPQQKKEMVLALKKIGRTVAMTGDGVNDVLALKEADCSIAMASGSEAAKNIANVVLLDSNFASMPHIVDQGRKVINNIRTAASMFLVKTFFSVFLSLLTIGFGEVYPFEPIQMSLISACAVGIPTFLLAQESNFQKVDNTFLRHVFMNALPTAFTITLCVFGIMLVCQNVYHSYDMLSTACVLVTGWSYMAALRTVYQPLNTFRKVVITGMQVLFLGGALIFQDILNFQSLEFGMIILVFFLMTVSPNVIDFVTSMLNRLRVSVEQKQATRLGKRGEQEKNP